MVQILTSEWAKVHEQMINIWLTKLQYTDKWTNDNNAVLHNFLNKSYTWDEQNLAKHTKHIWIVFFKTYHSCMNNSLLIMYD